MDFSNQISVGHRVIQSSDSGIENCSEPSGGNSSLLHGSNLAGISTSEATSAIADLSETQDDITQDEEVYGEGGDFVVEQRRQNTENCMTVSLTTEPTDTATCSHSRKSTQPMELNLSICQSRKRSKTCEQDLQEERDTFSPLETEYYNDQGCSGEQGECSRRENSPKDIVQNSELSVDTDNRDNKILDKRKLKVTSSTKEEKQRQNEEIVIMETSSVSSETGSWESLFPQRTDNEVKDCCTSFLQNERHHNVNCNTKATRALHTHTANQEFQQPSSSAVSACFIDASSLLDESELANYRSMTPQNTSTIVTSTTSELIPINATSEISSDRSENSDKDNWPKKRHLEKLETFHRSFELCKAKTLQPANVYFGSESPSSSSEESPQRVSSSSGENSNNLSDEEKLLKRESSKRKLTRLDVKDQYNNGSDRYKDLFSRSVERNDSFSARQGTLDLGESQILKLRKADQERKQGNLVFQNSINQYSGHLLSPKIPYAEESIVSNPASLIASEHESYQRNCDTSSNFGDASDCADSSHSMNSRSLNEAVDRSLSCFLPGTPNNSIVQVLSDSRDGSLEHETEGGIKVPKRSQRCSESAPIVSGGASIKDFIPKQCESPTVRRKTETCPIVSGGFASSDIILDEPIKPKERPKKLKSLASWVVDMSDCQKSERRRSTSSTSSTENVERSADASLEPPGSATSQSSSLGFYVSLNDMRAPAQLTDNCRKIKGIFHDYVKKPTGFYVDMSGSESSQNATPPPSVNNHTPPVSSNGEKKNIFSMFIDFGEKKPFSKRGEPLSLASRLSSSLHQRQTFTPKEAQMSSSVHYCGTDKLDSEGEQIKSSSDESKQPSMLTEEYPSDVLNTFLTKSSQRDELKRHSWNSSQPTSGQYEEYKRSSSLTTDKGGIMNILEKIPLISQTSSMSVDSSLSPFEDFSCSKSELSTFSNKSNSTTSISVHSSAGENCHKEKTRSKKRRCDAKINETFDKSSQGSLTDGVLSNDLSPASTTDTEDVTFQQDESVAVMAASETSVLLKDNGRPTVMETIIETKETASPKKQILEREKLPVVEVNIDSITVKPVSHTMETLHATIEKQKQLLETVNENFETGTNFVRLADMDKPISKFELHSPEILMSKSVGSHRHISRLFHDNRTRPHSWTMTRSQGNSIMNITNSVENLKSLTRLFPHLSKELSNSLPADVTFDPVYKSPNDGDYLHSDLSGESSLASSISRSGMDESSISCRQPRRLGEDLLKMFLQEIATDVMIEVNGRRLKAHKCILRSRCQYFAAMLAGSWVQSAGNVISLPGYSYSAVHFALCHIYSGASHPPEGISLMELAALADLLGLEGLKEVTAYALKMNYCHNFHKPCSGCIDGILQVLPVALNHTLDDLYRKCLKWTCKHYLKVWPSRAFAHLPSDIYGRCRQQIVAHLTSETVLDTILDCDHLISQLAPCRWAIAIENLVREILDSSFAYIADHFASLVASDSFLSLGHDRSPYISHLESILLRTASSLNPDQACRSYQRIRRLDAVLAAKVIRMPGNLDAHVPLYAEEIGGGDDMDWNEEFIRLVNAILSAVEQCLTRQCARAMRVGAWQRMDLELRKKIQKLACLTEPLDLRRGKQTVYKQSSASSGSRTQDLYQVKLAIQAHSKRALAQDSSRAATHIQTHSNHVEIQTTQRTIHPSNDGNHGSGKNRTKISVRSIYKPDQIVTQKKPSEKLYNFGHRRTQSEDSSKSMNKIAMQPLPSQQKNAATISTRLSDVRPRYLEPRKTRGTVRSDTSSSIGPQRGKHISSSESSRNSSPAAGKQRAGPNRPIGRKSVNMSLDSLASPSKKADKLKHLADLDISVDSLANSMKSSMRTDKTVSQEYLGSHDLNAKKDISVAKNTSISRSNPMINKDNRQTPKLMVHQQAKNKSLSCQTTSNGSPFSATNKSSRLPSNTSSVSSPRVAYKNRSISVPIGPNEPRKSFLSAKSREILARKSSNSSQSTVSSVKSQNNNTKPLTACNSNNSKTVNKSASTSNIPTRRTMPPTTLHLRKTAKLIPSDISSPTISSQLKANQKIVTGAGVQKTNSNRKIPESVGKDKRIEKFDLVIKSPQSGNKELKIESKLERSSTFCKETSDLPISELQVID